MSIMLRILLYSRLKNVEVPRETKNGVWHRRFSVSAVLRCLPSSCFDCVPNKIIMRNSLECYKVDIGVQIGMP
jgi:hypothetical protein